MSKARQIAKVLSRIIEAVFIIYGIYKTSVILIVIGIVSPFIIKQIMWTKEDTIAIRAKLEEVRFHWRMLTGKF